MNYQPEQLVFRQHQAFSSILTTIKFRLQNFALIKRPLKLFRTTPSLLPNIKIIVDYKCSNSERCRIKLLAMTSFRKKKPLINFRSVYISFTLCNTSTFVHVPIRKLLIKPTTKNKFFKMVTFRYAERFLLYGNSFHAIASCIIYFSKPNVCPIMRQSCYNLITKGIQHQSFRIFTFSSLPLNIDICGLSVVGKIVYFLARIKKKTIQNIVFKILI